MQSRGIAAVRGAEPTPAFAALPGIALEVDDLFLADELVTVRATVVNGTLQSCGGLEAEIYPLASADPAWTVPLSAVDETTANATLQGLSPGAYRISVRTYRASSQGPSPVTDIFQTIGR